MLMTENKTNLKWKRETECENERQTSNEREIE